MCAPKVIQEVNFRKHLWAIMHGRDCSCAPRLRFFYLASGGATANCQIPDHSFGKFFFTCLRKDSIAKIMHRFERCFCRLLEDQMYFTMHYTFRSSVGRWRHKIHKFAAVIFQNAKKLAAELCQILHIVTIYIVVNCTHV